MSASLATTSDLPNDRGDRGGPSDPINLSPYSRPLVTLLFALALGWAASVFGATETQNSFRLSLMLSVPMLIAAWFLGRKPFSDLRFLPAAGIGLLLLTRITIASSLEAPGLAILSCGWLAFFLTLLLAAGPHGDEKRVLLVLILLGVAEALVGLIQSVGGLDYIGTYHRQLGRRASGTLINPNHFAALLNMTLGLALGVLYAGFHRRRVRQNPVRSEKYAWAWSVLLCSSFVGLGVVASLSRSGLVTLILMMIFVSLIWGTRDNQRDLKLGPILLLLLVLGMGAWVGLERLFSRFETTGSNGMQRILICWDTLKLIGSEPILGVGPGLYKWRFRPYQTVDTAHLYASAHNDYLHSAAEWGIPLALLFWCFVIWRLYRSTKLFLGEKEPWRAGLSLGCSAAILALLLHSFTDSSLRVPLVLMVFCSVLAISCCQEKPLTWRRPAANLLWRVPLSILLILAGGRVFQHLVVVESVRTASSPEHLEPTLKWDPEADQAAFQLGRLYRDRVAHQDLGRALEYLQRAAELNPHSWEYGLELARCLELLNRDLDARQEYQRTISLNPHSAPYQWRFANFLLRADDREASLQHLARSVSLDPAYRKPLFDLLLRMGASSREVEQVWPRDQQSRIILVESVLRKTRLSDSEHWVDLIDRSWSQDPEGVLLPKLLSRARQLGSAPLWFGFLEQRLGRALRDRSPLTVSAAVPFLDYLVEIGRVKEAREYWLLLTRKNALIDSSYHRGDSLVWNGDFELPLIDGGGFDWRIYPSSGNLISISPAPESSGDALKLDFDGTENLNFSGLRQLVAIPGPGPYRLNYRVRAEGISTEEGLYFEVTDHSGERTLVRTRQILKSVPWRTESAAFTVPPGVSSVWLLLRRNLSRRIDNRLRGKLWLDLVRIQPEHSSLADSLPIASDSITASSSTHSEIQQIAATPPTSEGSI